MEEKITESTNEFVTRVNRRFARQKHSVRLVGIPGKKYDRVVAMPENRAYLFIDRETGNIYRPRDQHQPHLKEISYPHDRLEKAIKNADKHGTFHFLQPKYK